MPRERTLSQAISWFFAQAASSKYTLSPRILLNAWWRFRSSMLSHPFSCFHSFGLVVSVVTSRRHYEVELSKSAEDWQSQVVRGVNWGVTERFSGWRGGRKRLGVGAEGAAAGGIVGWGELPGVDWAHVEIFVQLGHCGPHGRLLGLWLGVGEVKGVARRHVVPPEHRELLHSAAGLLLGWRLSWGVPHLVHGVDEMTSRSVRTEAHTVVGPTQICLVFRVSGHGSQILNSVSKLAFLSVFARSIFLKGSTHLGLVSGSVLDRGGDGGTGTSLALAPVHQGSAWSHWAISVKAGQRISQWRVGGPQVETKWLSLTLVNLNPQTLETVLSDLEIWDSVMSHEYWVLSSASKKVTRKIIKCDSWECCRRVVYFSSKLGRKEGFVSLYLCFLFDVKRVRWETPAPSFQC